MKFRLVEDFEQFNEDIAVLDRTSEPAMNTKTIRYIVQAVPVKDSVSKQTIVTKFSDLKSVIQKHPKNKFRCCYVHTQQYDPDERAHVDIDDTITIINGVRGWDLSKLNNIKNKVEN